LDFKFWIVDSKIYNLKTSPYLNTARFVHFQLGIWFWEKVKGFFFPLSPSPFPLNRQVLAPIQKPGTIPKHA